MGARVTFGAESLKPFTTRTTLPHLAIDKVNRCVLKIRLCTARPSDNVGAVSALFGLPDQ